MEDRYLGDGVYASFDGWNVVLDLRGQDSFTRIALEPEVQRQLEQYCREANHARLKPQENGDEIS